MIRKGITGSFHSVDPRPLPHVAPKVFKSICYAIARAVGMSVVKFKPCGPTPNFHLAVLKGRNEKETIAIVCNATFPIVAFAEPPSEGQCSLTFRDDERLAAAFRLQGGFEVASASDLSAAVRERELSELGPVEREEVRYWRPQTVGEIVFNWFD